MADLGRSKSWKPVFEDDSWRPTTTTTVQRGNTSASDTRYHLRRPQQPAAAGAAAHYRSASGTSQFHDPVSPLDQGFSQMGYGRGDLHKSASLRSTTSQGHGGYARSVLTRGRVSPGTTASLNWDHLTPPSFHAKSEDNHAARGVDTLPLPPRSGPIPGIGQGVASPTLSGFPGVREDQGGADVRRHQSLQQGFGHSTKVRERLARSQALLPPDQRTPTTNTHAAYDPMDGEKRDRRPSETTRNVWSLNAGTGDGWAQVDVAMRARANATPPYGREGAVAPGRGTPPALGHAGDGYERDGYRAEQAREPYHAPGRDTLMHAFAGMHLEPALGGFPSPAGLPPATAAGGDPYRTFTPYAQGYPDDYAGYAVRAVPSGVEEYPTYGAQGGYTFAPGILSPPTIVSPQPGATMMQHTTSNSYAPSQHQHQQQPPIVPDYIARAAEYEVHQMIAKRRLNPPDFHCEPENARFFVIKSFTEDDVHKSLKHEIWSSTTYGNQRLDKAFAEARGPVYLFFSVNGSGHFCGVAQMLSAVDYNQTSTVWAQDKWKGIFKLRWIFVKDIPNGALRHIRLLNTQEQKPITNSRDTQELMWDAGCEVLAIFSKFREKTSLLQDWGFHEMQALEKAQRQQPPSAQHTPVMQAGFEGQEMPPLPHGEARHTGADNGSDLQGRGVGKPGLVKGFSATGPPSLTGQNQGFSVVSRGNKAVTKIF